MLEIRSEAQLQRFCGDVLRANGFRKRRVDFTAFQKLFPHISVTDDVLRTWVQNGAAPGAVIPDS